jgi:DNA repair protein RAD50
MALYKEESDRLQLTLKQSEVDSAVWRNEMVGLFEANAGIFEGLRLVVAPDTITDIDRLQRALSDTVGREKGAMAAQRSTQQTLTENLAKFKLLQYQMSGRRLELSRRREASIAGHQTITAFIPEVSALRTYFTTELPPLSPDLTPTEVLAACEEVMEITAQTCSTLDTRQSMFEKLERTRAKANDSCPCCKRGMSGAEVAVYQDQMARLFKTEFFSKKDACEERRTRAQDILSTVRAALSSSSVNDAASIEQELETTASEEEDYNRQTNQLLLEVKEGIKGIQTAEELLSKYDRLAVELASLRRRRLELDERLKELRDKHTKQSQSVASTNVDGRTYIAMEVAVRERMAERDELQVRKDRVQAEESKASKRQFQLKAAQAEADKVLVEAQSKAERLHIVQARLGELEKLSKQAAITKTSTMLSIARMQSEASMAGTAVVEGKDALLRAEQDWAMRTNLSRGDVQELARLTAEVEVMRQREERCDLASIERELREAHALIEDHEEALRVAGLEMGDISGALSNEERTRKLIQDNLDVRATEREVGGLRERLRVQRARAEPDTRKKEDTEREVQRAGQERVRLSTEEATICGQLKEVDSQVAELDVKLGNSTYRNIHERHRRKNIEYETTLLAVADLDSYYNALDGALATYHLMKIKEINKIIRELWQQVYRGDDIDRIE